MKVAPLTLSFYYGGGPGPMGKFIATVVILIIAAGVVFFFGWVQYELPPNSYGVIFTKSHGWEPTVIRPGTFVWRWQRLLPTNLTLYAFPANPASKRISVTGTLPSAESYAQQLTPEPDFSYRIELALTLRIRPDKLVELAREQSLLPADMDEWYEGIADAVEAAAPRLVMNAVSDAVDEGSALPTATLEDQLRPALADRFPAVDFDSLTVRELRVPDMDLYAAAKENYLASVSAQGAAAAAAAAAESERTAQMESRLQLLRNYGDVLDSYPVLLDYFRLQAETGIDPLGLAGSPLQQ